MEFTYTRTYRSPLRAVLLDWAGTTVDFGCMAPAAVFVQVFSEQGIGITMTEARGPMGLHKRDHIRAITRVPRVAEQWRQVHGTDCTEENVEAMFQAFVPQQLAIIADHADLVPGVAEAQAEFRRRDMRIGTSTGYNNEMMDVLSAAAAERGYKPDRVVCATDVPAGRPAPWMAYRNAMELGVYPMEAWVKIGDTRADVEEGLNAGMWTVGVVLSGNEMGLTQQEVAELAPADLAGRRAAARERLLQAGAHEVIDSLAETAALLDRLEERLRRGEKP